MTDPILKELKSLTGWDRISKVGDSYVISMHITEARKVTGIQVANGTYSLTIDDFDTIPISFLVESDDAQSQYWTLKKRLHRANGLPAYVVWHPKWKLAKRSWYWYGLLHRVNGPAKEEYYSYELSYGRPDREEDFRPHHKVESWVTYRAEWHQEGVRTTFPFPNRMKAEHGYRILKNNNDRVVDDVDDIPAFYLSFSTHFWEEDEEIEILSTVNGPYDYSGPDFMACQLSLSGLQDHYQNGVFQKRTCEKVLTSTWAKSGYLITPDGDVNDMICKSLVPNYRLFGGEFFRQEQDELITISEVNE